MELLLAREPSDAVSTLGRLSLNGVFQCWTLEDPVHGGPKTPGTTAIPAGRYRIRLSFSHRFQRTLCELLDVPGFTGVRIHAGNTARDTEGCLLVGQGRAHDSILGSRLALAALQPQIAGALARGDSVWITIHDASPVPA